MKRDMELVREILLKVEKAPYDGRFHDIEVEGRSHQEIAYHVMILHEARLLEATNRKTHHGIDWKPKRLTYAGHEFLDAARSSKVWEAAKSWLSSTTGTLTIEGLKTALPEVTKRIIQGAL
jgi:hypothetical protein